jgi:GNAT superfamily N-acetyltransferase
MFGTSPRVRRGLRSFPRLWIFSFRRTNLVALQADPHIVETWARGWALSRGTPPPVPTAGAFRIDVGLPQHKTRYIFSQVSDDVRRLAETILDPEVHIKVCAPPEAVQRLLPSHWMIERLGFMMTRPPANPATPPLPEGYRGEASIAPPILSVRVTIPSGLATATGRVALVGPFAIYDQIETHEAHRRRGLGNFVMHALGKHASDQGVNRGVLVATADGRALYTTLGWQMHSLYTTAVVRRDSSAEGCLSE